MTTKEIATFAKECYPKGRVSTRTSDNGCTIYIHFPEFVITNSLNLKHTIRDLFVRVSFTYRHNGRWGVNMTGMRATMTHSESISSYTQSHLDTGELGRWGVFCLGSAGIAQLKANIESGMNVDGSIKGFIIGIERYLKWESKEGGPYRNIENIRSNNSILTDTQVALIQDYFSTCQPFDYPTIVNCGYLVNIDITPEQVKGYIVRSILQNKRRFIRYCHDYNIPVNNVYGYQGRTTEIRHCGEVSIARKKYELKIIPDEKTTKDKQREVHPNLVLWTKRKLIKEAIRAITYG
jgi:hypothetical protein